MSRLGKNIRLSLDFFNHPKTLKLERRLGAKAVTSLLTLWCWAKVYRPDGDLSGLDDEDIEWAAKWNKTKKGELIPVLLDLRWLDKTESGYVMHEWQGHQRVPGR